MSGPRIALEDLGGYDITQAEDLPGRYVVDVNGQVELEATLAELENVAYNILSLVSGQRLDLYRQLVDQQDEGLDAYRQLGGEL